VPAGPLSVSWSGADTATPGGPGSGIASYDVYVSDDNAPFALWLNATTASSASYPAVDGHVYRFYSRGRDKAGNLEQAAISPDAITTAGSTPPVALAVSYDQGAPVTLAESGRYLAVRFSANVKASLDLADVTVKNLTTGQNALLTPVQYDDATNTALFSFGTYVIPDGNYEMHISAAGVSDSAGRQLDGDGDGVSGGDVNFAFFSLNGDANRDRSVDFLDLAALAQNYNISGGRTWSQGNFNGDGNVDFLDLAILAQRYNTSLPASPMGGASPAWGIVSVSSDPMPSLASVIAQLDQPSDPAPPPSGSANTSGAKPTPKPVVQPKPEPKLVPAMRPATPVKKVVPPPVVSKKVTPNVVPPVFSVKKIVVASRKRSDVLG
jgi:hypothetical protein